MSETPSDPLPLLMQPLEQRPGIGPHRAARLSRLGLRTAADLLFCFPRSYLDYTQLDLISQLEDGQAANVVGEVADLDQTTTRHGKHMLFVLIRQETQVLRGIWFNQDYLVRKFQAGQRVLFRGQVKLSGGRFQMTHPKVTWLENDLAAQPEAHLTPVYPLTDGIHQSQMRQWIADHVELLAPVVQEAIPARLRASLNLMDIETAIRKIHAPRDQPEAEAARQRLVYQELFVLQLALAMRRHQVQADGNAPPMELTPSIRSRILSRLPFQLSDSQNQALDEIGRDLGRPFPMNRLVHGEVGSGKTALAICALLTAVAHGYQAVLMAPTEILARQHFATLQEWLQNSRVRLGLWTGSLTASQRKPLKASIESGETQIVIGTQAVVASQLPFDNLGLVVIDEQHKFGVRQRAQLRQSKYDPHYLVMTATPIPRTVAMTLFGDLDTTVLTRSHGAGQVVHTYLGEAASRESWWEFFRKKLREGRQGYVVAPLVDGDDDSQIDSAERLYERLANGPLSDFRLDLVHGRQTADEKEQAMSQFSGGHTQVLVATGVIEVGINVPNATVMTIESGERFGLSQLHQLRGRVSRGKHAGFVCVFSSQEQVADNERLQAFSTIDNGFELAEMDLQLRGPGNLFSTQQSGFPPLRIADLIRDANLLALAQQDARALIAADSELAAEDLQRLRTLVISRYGAALDLSDVG